MQRKHTLIVIAAVIVVVAAAAIIAVLMGGGASSPASQENAASSTVAAFGKTLQQVSLLAPDASSTIASTYAPYVDPALLTQWEANPQSAPGRVTSSPWPDHIAITSITPQGQGYVVNGQLVFMTSNEVEHGGNADTTPVVLQLVRENNRWMIVAFQAQSKQ
jgi:hypothetical protein